MLESIRDYRDRLMRFGRSSVGSQGPDIAKLLLQTQHDSGNSRRLEAGRFGCASLPSALTQT